MNHLFLIMHIFVTVLLLESLNLTATLEKAFFNNSRTKAEALLSRPTTTATKVKPVYLVSAYAIQK